MSDFVASTVIYRPQRQLLVKYHHSLTQHLSKFYRLHQYDEETTKA